MMVSVVSEVIKRLHMRGVGYELGWSLKTLYTPVRTPWSIKIHPELLGTGTGG